MNRAENASLIKLKLLKLLALQKQLNAELDAAKTEIETLKTQLSESRKREEIAQERNKISKLAVGIQLNGKKQVELKQYLNSHINQIDECLKLLNQLSDNT